MQYISALHTVSANGWNERGSADIEVCSGGRNELGRRSISSAGAFIVFRREEATLECGVMTTQIQDRCFRKK